MSAPEYKKIPLPTAVNELLDDLPEPARRPFKRGKPFKSLESRSADKAAGKGTHGEGRPQTALTDPDAPPSERYMLIARHHLQGLTHAEIARRLGFSASHVSQVIRSPIVQKYIASFRRGAEDRAESQQLRIIELGEKAINALEEAIDDGDTKDRISAANSLLDRNPNTSKHTKQKAEKRGATPEDIARWRGDVITQAEAVDAEFVEVDSLDEETEEAL